MRRRDTGVGGSLRGPSRRGLPASLPSSSVSSGASTLMGETSYFCALSPSLSFSARVMLSTYNVPSWYWTQGNMVLDTRYWTQGNSNELFPSSLSPQRAYSLFIKKTLRC